MLLRKAWVFVDADGSSCTTKACHWSEPPGHDNRDSWRHEQVRDTGVDGTMARSIQQSEANWRAFLRLDAGNLALFVTLPAVPQVPWYSMSWQPHMQRRSSFASCFLVVGLTRGKAGATSLGLTHIQNQETLDQLISVADTTEYGRLLYCCSSTRNQLHASGRGHFFFPCACTRAWHSSPGPGG